VKKTARACALGMTIACAAAVPASAQSAPLKLSLADARIAYDKPVMAHGRLGAEYAGREIQLEYRSGGAWHGLARAAVAADGRWRIAVRLPRTALVRATLQPAPGSATASTVSATSRERRVALTARVGVGKRRFDVKAGRRAHARGQVLPAARGRKVLLQVRNDGRWRTLDRDRTAADGRFSLRRRVHTSMDRRVRIVVTGGKGLARTASRAGRLQVYRYTHASWYGPGFYGQRTGCGGTLQYGQVGVAHKSLPCGTKVTFRHRGRSVRVPVIDRGPYVAGREYDLTAAAAQKLRFRGHGSILVTR
jgi:hypothetical protein